MNKRSDKASFLGLITGMYFPTELGSTRLDMKLKRKKFNAFESDETEFPR